jgi:uncharacterized membrane protein YdjX (TVP38/TMEM64 family)
VSTPALETQGPEPARKPGWARFLPLALIAAGLVVLFIFGGEYLSFDIAFGALRERREALQAYVADHRVVALLAFMGLYMAVTALSVPGATILTLAGGFLFGVWLGGAATVVAATAGAVLVFLAARAAAGDFLRRKAGPGIARIEQGVRENAFSYLLSLRLLPILPFWLVNLASGFVDIPLRTYASATFLGIIPGTFIYAGVGAGLGAVFEGREKLDLGVIFKPDILLPLLALALLSLAPTIWKRVRGRKATA